MRRRGAGAGAGLGLERAKARIEEAAARGDAYELAQLVQSVAAREREPLDAWSLAMHGVTRLAAVGAFAEIEKVTTEAVQRTLAARDSETTLLLCEAVVEQLRELAPTWPPSTRRRVVEDALDAVAAVGDPECATLVQDLHRLAARAAREQGALPFAYEHYLRAEDAADLATFLISWAASLPPAERPLVLLRACMHLLSFGNLRDARAILQDWEGRGLVPTEAQTETASLAMAEASSSSHSVRCAGALEWGWPTLQLLNLVRFTSDACQHADKSLFAMLRSAYDKPLAAEPELRTLFDRITTRWSRP